MTSEVSCPGCGALLPIASDKIGHSLTCVGCAAVSTVLEAGQTVLISDPDGALGSPRRFRRSWTSIGIRIATVVGTLALTCGVPWYLCGLLLDGCQADYSPLSGIDGWTIQELRASELRHRAVLAMTNQVELPTNAFDIFTAYGSFRQGGSRHYLIFRTDRAGAETFVLRFLGQPLSELGPPRDSYRTLLRCDRQVRMNGFPWRALRVQNARYSRRPRSHNAGGAILVDMTTNTIYITF